MYIYIYIYDVYTIIMTLHIIQFSSQPSSICLWHIVSLEWMVFNCFYVRKHLFHGSLPTPSVCPFRIQIRQSMTAEAWSHLQIFLGLVQLNSLCVKWVVVGPRVRGRREHVRGSWDPHRVRQTQVQLGRRRGSSILIFICLKKNLELLLNSLYLPSLVASKFHAKSKR